MHVISHVMSSTTGSCNNVQYYELLLQGSFASFCGVHHDKQFSVLNLNFWGWCHVSVDGGYPNDDIFHISNAAVHH